MLNLGRALLMKGHIEEAITRLLTLKDIYPNDTETCNLLALCYSKVSEWHAALSISEESLALQPEQPETQKQVALLRLRCTLEDVCRSE